ncbi:MAG: SIS domain-containing protein [Verrucomicrobiota bacterium]
MTSFAHSYFRKLQALLDQVDTAAIDEAIRMLEESWKASKVVYVIGNGGSASTASHYACDLNKNTVHPDYPRLKVMSLCDNVALFSAIANDYGYQHVFTEQLKHFFQPGDVLIGISASGNSPNVVEAFEYAASAGGRTIGVTGFTGGRIRQIADCSIYIPSDEYGPVEDVQLMVNHLITEYFKGLVRTGSSATLA